MTTHTTHPRGRAIVGLTLAGAALLGGCTDGGQALDPSAAGSSSAGQSDIARLGDCLKDAGFGVTIDERQNAVGYVGAEGDMTRYDGVYKACSKQLGL